MTRSFIVICCAALLLLLLPFYELGLQLIALLLVPLWHLPRCVNDVTNSLLSPQWLAETLIAGPELQQREPAREVEESSAKCHRCRRGYINATKWCKMLRRGKQWQQLARSAKTSFVTQVCRSPGVLGPLPWCQVPSDATNASRRIVLALRRALAAGHPPPSAQNWSAASMARSILQHVRHDAAACESPVAAAVSSPVLVLGDVRMLEVGMGNVFAALSGAIATARALGAGCVVTMVGYTASLFTHGKLAVFPCVAVRGDVFDALRKGARNGDITITDWELQQRSLLDATAARSSSSTKAASKNNATSGPPPHKQQLVLDLKFARNPLRPDTCFDDVAPGMPAPLVTTLMRRVLVDLLQSFERQVPLTAEEQRLAHAGDTLCGHMRQYHAEARAASHAGSVRLQCMLDCGGVLSAMDAIFAADITRHTTYSFSGCLDCRPCVRLLAPRLAAHATFLPPPKRACGFHSHESTTNTTPHHTNAAAAVADWRLLTHCRTIVLDDAGGGTYARLIAGAGGLSHCGNAPEVVAKLQQSRNNRSAARVLPTAPALLARCTRPPCGSRVLCRGQPSTAQYSACADEQMMEYHVEQAVQPTSSASTPRRTPPAPAARGSARNSFSRKSVPAYSEKR